MYLKRIEIHGFKSFANKTVMQFPEGVTCIVGPNGSGKSNISDAIRWVLGEQKVKQLRGSSMQDVIFAGTEIKKPQGFALVAITLDNKEHALPIDYTEVTVSRRLYRSGESEYMINGNEVRLKDIQELFYDTGIGKEGYSIIGQGQIDAILNGRPEDRRGLFDEAVGIVKFKRRRQLAEKKLESERASLIRVSDILSELQRQVGPLKNQAEKARKYLDYRENLKKYDLNLFLRNTESLIEELNRMKENYKIAEDALCEAKAEQEDLKNKYDVFSEEIKRLSAFSDSNKEEIQKLLISISDIRSDLELTSERISSSEAFLENTNVQLEKLADDIEQRKHKIAGYIAELSDIENEISILSEEEETDILLSSLSKLRQDVGFYKLFLKKNLLLKDDEIDKLIAEHSANAYKKQDDSNALSENKTFAVNNDWLNRINIKKSKIAELLKEKEDSELEIKNLSDKNNKLSEDIKNLKETINSLSRDYHIADTRLENIKNMAERYEGYGQSIRFVMQLRDRVRGIRGVVADLIHTKKEYETAIETALGGSIQNIVTDSEETAKILIQHLKKNKAGRATFLPLSALSYKEQTEYKKALAETGAIGRASDIVSCDEEFKNLSEYLLSKTLVVDNIDNALRIAAKFKHSLRIVTLDGELLSPGGSLSGGAYRNNSNLIGRAREVKELSEKRDEILRKNESFSRELEEAEKNLNTNNILINELRSKVSDILMEENTLRLQISSDTKLRYSGISQNISFKLENLKRLSEELGGLITELSDSKRKALSSQAFLEQMKASIADKVKLKAETEKKLEELRVVDKQNTEKLSELSLNERSFFDKREENSSIILNYEKEILRLENIIEKTQDKLDNITDYIWKEYELTFSSAKEYYDENIGSSAYIKAEADKLKALIRALGPVNVQAIEEYNECSERYEFLKVQYNDLSESEKAIEAIIKELNVEMRKQFSEKFEEIRIKFDKVFKELFGGGYGNLELVTDESEDLLEAGIAINVQPPGKKLQNMMQLSGGEKALSAIALLFAIQSLKPSPFCVLDEIEAALDDSNVSRFASYLHRLSDKTQFVVITHRRGTMESADRLYGITMQEKGITTLVSVDLVSDRLS
ncbi:MAG: chromosome segregation protein SMC [Eubacteriales bacterium]|nr:chromosome segregation protein SMC [Eubacteriales bacterium]